MKTQELEHDEVRSKVRETYGKVAGNDAGCGCAPTCCGRSPEDAPPARDAAAVSQGLGYSAQQTGAVPAVRAAGRVIGTELSMYRRSLRRWRGSLIAGATKSRRRTG